MAAGEEREFRILILVGVTACCHPDPVHLCSMNDTGEGPPKSRLLIVADYGVVREGLLALFRAAGKVEAAAGAEEAAWVTQHFAPHVILIDLALSDCDPRQVARSILDRCPASRLLLLEDGVNPAHVRVALTIGACGYWTKHASFDQLAEAVRCVAAGQSSFCPAAQKYLDPTDCNCP